MRKLVLATAALVALGTAPALLAQDAPKAPDAGPAPAKPAAPARKPVKEPSKQVAEKISESLKAILTGSGAARVAAGDALEGAVAEWAVDAKDDPLKSTAWWRGALAGTMNTASHRAGLAEVKIPLDGREAKLWVSTPKSYSPKNLHPMVLVILDKGDDAKRFLQAAYGDLQREWIVVGISMDPKVAGFDLAREPWLAALGLRHAIEDFRVDLDRVVLDAGTDGANLAMNLGSEWAVHFSGVILRAPTLLSPLSSNLALCGTAAVMPDTPTPAQKLNLEAMQKALPGLVVIPASTPAEVQKWLGALPPRRISDPSTLTFSWKTRPQGGEPWAYWFWVFRAADAKKERLVDLTFLRTEAGGVVEIKGDNLAEGRLLLNDDLLYLDKEVVVRVNGTEVWKGIPQRRISTALYWIGQSGERTLFAPAEIRFTVPAQAAAAPKAPLPKDGDGKAPGGG